MPLPQFLQRFRPGASTPEAPVQPLSEADIEQARVLARRRMVGMAVLVAAGVVGFPWLFETQPRPLNGEVQVVSQVASGAGSSVSLVPRPQPARAPMADASAGPSAGASAAARETIETIEPPAARSASVQGASHEASPASAAQAAVAPRQSALVTPAHDKPAAQAQAEEKAHAEEKARAEAKAKAEAKARAEAKAKAEEKARAEARSKAEEKARAEAKAKAEDKARAEAKSKAEDKARAEAKAKAEEKTRAEAKAKAEDKARAEAKAKADKDKADKQAKDKGAADGDTRFVVQVGAFNDAEAAQAVRQKVEKLGIKTYAQVIDSPQGKKTRVRVGPFGNRAEAEKILATLKKAGLNAGVLTL